MELTVYRDFPEDPLPAGILARTEGEVAFRYHEDYLASPAAAPLSLSLPLQAEPYTEEELTPYFRGLLPEGAALENLCRSLGIPQDDYIAMLAACGLDCLGDVIIDPAVYTETRSYEAVSLDQIKEMAGKPGKIDESLEMARLSLAGTQNKCGLFHDPAAPITEGWYQPVGAPVELHRQICPRGSHRPHAGGAPLHDLRGSMRTRCGSNRPHQSVEAHHLRRAL